MFVYRPRGRETTRKETFCYCNDWLWRCRMRGNQKCIHPRGRFYTRIAVNNGAAVGQERRLRKNTGYKLRETRKVNGPKKQGHFSLIVVTTHYGCPAAGQCYDRLPRHRRFNRTSLCNYLNQEDKVLITIKRNITNGRLPLSMRFVQWTKLCVSQRLNLYKTCVRVVVYKKNKKTLLFIIEHSQRRTDKLVLQLHDVKPIVHLWYVADRGEVSFSYYYYFFSFRTTLRSRSHTEIFPERRILYRFGKSRELVEF